MLDDCKITVQDIKNAEDIFGPDIFALKGKTTRTKPTKVQLEYLEVPAEILERHRKIILAVDIMYVQGIMFFVSISRFLKFTTAQYIESRKAATLVECIANIQAVYKTRGFEIVYVIADPEIIPVEVDLQGMGIKLNPTSTSEHVPEIERQIRVLKERIRSAWSKLPYKYKPRILIRFLVQTIVMWLNNFPPRGGVSQTLSPRQLIVGNQLSAKLHCRIEFGAYAQVHEENTPTNSMTPRTIGAICLGPTGNAQGGYRFMSLLTGKLLYRRSFSVVPVTDLVIDHVNALGMRDEVREDLRIETTPNSLTDKTTKSFEDDVTDSPTNDDQEEIENFENFEDEKDDLVEMVQPSTISGVDDDIVYGEQEQLPVPLPKPKIMLPTDVLPQEHQPAATPTYVTRSGRESKPVM
jgi:hypothetical protein